MDKLPIYYATIEGQEDGIFCVSLVDFPAVERNFVCFDADKKVVTLAVQNEEERMLSGVVMLANSPIYRRDDDGYEYYIVYTPETIKGMAQKMLRDGYQNNIDIQHDGELVKGVELVELYIKDSSKGINPTYIEDVPDGSLMATYHCENDEIWNAVKNGEVKGFSLAGMFSVKQEFKNKKEQKNKPLMNKIKELLAKMLMTMGAVATDKGNLVWEGDEDLKEGVIVTKEDGSEVEDGEYATEDGKIITVEGGKVAKIEDKAAEVAPEEPAVIEETPVAAEEEPAPEAPAEEAPVAEEPEEPEFDVKAEIEAIKADIEALKEVVAHIVEKPVAEPIEQSFEKATKPASTGNKGLDRAIARFSTLKK